jgi:hypothetical protein
MLRKRITHLPGNLHPLFPWSKRIPQLLDYLRGFGSLDTVIGPECLSVMPPSTVGELEVGQDGLAVS